MSDFGVYFQYHLDWYSHVVVNFGGWSLSLGICHSWRAVESLTQLGESLRRAHRSALNLLDTILWSALGKRHFIFDDNHQSIDFLSRSV